MYFQIRGELLVILDRILGVEQVDLSIRGGQTILEPGCLLKAEITTGLFVDVIG